MKWTSWLSGMATGGICVLEGEVKVSCAVVAVPSASASASASSLLAVDVEGVNESPVHTTSLPKTTGPSSGVVKSPACSALICRPCKGSESFAIAVVVLIRASALAWTSST